MQAVSIEKPQENITYHNKQYDTTQKYNFSGRQVNCMDKTLPYIITTGAIFMGWIAGVAASSTSFNPPTSYSNSTLITNSLDSISEHRTSSMISSAVASVTTILSYHLLNYCVNLKR